ncbi:MAG: trypsin-like serine protease [Candidatus Marinimicrobia bacterium]|nr:trypsin-like serine protease [Candidatus Neomarinimicrobiota bacterium]
MRILILVQSLIIVGSGYSQGAEHFLFDINLNDKKLSQSNYEAKITPSSLDHSSSNMNPTKAFYANSSKSIQNRSMGYDPMASGIKTRQLTGASHLYKRCVQSVVLLVSIDATSLGSGSVVDSEGNIITNWHVVDGNDQMLVWPYNKGLSQLTDLDPELALLANVVAIDPSRDLALLKLESKEKIPPQIVFSGPKSISIADDVFAIGHPEGYIWSFTYGVVSQLRSNFEWAYKNSNEFEADVIQTQTPSNPGNSGGPLFNGMGQLVGINSFSSEGQGLNFAVHVEEVTNFISGAKVGKYRDLSKNKTADSDEIVWLPMDLDENGVIDGYRTDSQDDGYYDFAKIDGDEDGTIDFMIFDADHDGGVEIYIFDEDGKEGFEHFYFDHDQDGNFDEHGVDEDGDGWPESTVPYKG